MEDNEAVSRVRGRDWYAERAGGGDCFYKSCLAYSNNFNYEYNIKGG